MITLLSHHGVETLNIAQVASGTVAGIDISGADVSKVVITGGTATTNLDINQGTNKLNKSVTEVDASAFLGDVIADASVAKSVGVNFKLGNLAITDTNSDSIVGSGSTTSKDTLSGTFAADDTTAEFTQFSGIETYNLTFKDGVNITSAANDGIGDGDNIVETITMSGGNSLTSYNMTTNAGAIDGTKLTTFDASGLGGKIELNVDGSRMDNLTVKGSTASAKDFVTYSAVNGLTATTGKASTEGVETVALRTATAASTIDAGSLAGVTTIAVENDQNVTLQNVAAGVGIQLGESTTGVDDYSGTVTIKLADTGTSDAVTISTVEQDADDDANAVIVMTGETTLYACNGYERYPVECLWC